MNDLSTARPDEGQRCHSQDQECADPRLEPAPDYGTLGAGSDFANTTAQALRGQQVPAGLMRGAVLVAAVVLAAIVQILFGRAQVAQMAWTRVADLFAPTLETGSNAPSRVSARERDHLDRLPAQKQAETLLELAIGSADGANEQIAARVDHWRGRIKLDPRLSSLTEAALNSNDLQVRASALEVQLAAYGLAKNSGTVDVLIQSTGSPNHAQKIWALWALGGLANRGVDTERAERALASHLKDEDEDSRRWAVEALALVGTNETVPTLLDAMHNDPSATVRERAACGLAEAGMLNHEQRLAAVPQLVSYTEDAALDSQTHAWAFQALGDITKQRLPNDSAAWRSWYASEKGE